MRKVELVGLLGSFKELGENVLHMMTIIVAPSVASGVYQNDNTLLFMLLSLSPISLQAWTDKTQDCQSQPDPDRKR